MSPSRRLRGALAAALAAAVIVGAGCDACAGPPAPPGTSSFFCTCECGVFVAGVAVPDQTRRSPRFEVCLTDESAPFGERLYARDIVELCDNACHETISEAARRVACSDRPDLCDEIACSEDLCRGALDDPGDVFVPRSKEDGGVPIVPDAGLVGFGFAPSCRPPPDAGFDPCEEVECAIEDVRGEPVCGDEVLQTGEDCDGPCNVFAVCPTLLPGTHGFVACSDECALLDDGCVTRDVDAGDGPDTADCVARNETSLQRRILDVLADCTVLPAVALTADCEREATVPLCVVR